MKQGARTDLAQDCAKSDASQADAAKLLGVSTRNVQKARKVRECGAPSSASREARQTYATGQAPAVCSALSRASGRLGGVAGSDDREASGGSIHSLFQACAGRFDSFALHYPNLRPRRRTENRPAMRDHTTHTRAPLTGASRHEDALRSIRVVKATYPAGTLGGRDHGQRGGTMEAGSARGGYTGADRLGETGGPLKARSSAERYWTVRGGGPSRG